MATFKKDTAHEIVRWEPRSDFEQCPGASELVSGLCQDAQRQGNGDWIQKYGWLGFFPAFVFYPLQTMICSNFSNWALKIAKSGFAEFARKRLDEIADHLLDVSSFSLCGLLWIWIDTVNSFCRLILFCWYGAKPCNWWIASLWWLDRGAGGFAFRWNKCSWSSWCYCLDLNLTCFGLWVSKFVLGWLRRRCNRGLRAEIFCHFAHDFFERQCIWVSMSLIQLTYSNLFIQSWIRHGWYQFMPPVLIFVQTQRFLRIKDVCSSSTESNWFNKIRAHFENQWSFSEIGQTITVCIFLNTQRYLTKSLPIIRIKDMH